MQIAQIAPLTEAIPPRLYGGTERVISWLTDELVARLRWSYSQAVIPAHASPVRANVVDRSALSPDWGQ